MDHRLDHDLRDGGVDLRDRCRGAVAARRARDHRRRGRDRPARRERRTTPAACTSSPRSPASARPTGIRTRAGAILGLTRGTGRAELARATVEAMAFQTADVVDAMTAASGARARGAARRRRREPDGPALPLPGRPARRPRASPGHPGDDRARRRVPRGSRRGRLGDAGRRGGAPGARRRPSSRRWPPTRSRPDVPAGPGRSSDPASWASTADAGPERARSARERRDPHRELDDLGRRVRAATRPAVAPLVA